MNFWWRQLTWNPTANHLSLVRWGAPLGPGLWSASFLDWKPGEVIVQRKAKQCPSARTHQPIQTENENQTQVCPQNGVDDNRKGMSTFLLIYFYSICSPSAKIKQTKMWIQPLGVVTELILWVLDYEGKPTDGMGLNECLDIGAPTRKSGLDTAAHRAEGTSNCWLEWPPRNPSQEGPSEMAVAFQVVLVSYCCCNQ